jgi:hypothetical protein
MDYINLTDQSLDAAMITDDEDLAAGHLARGQVRALQAIAAAINRLAEAVEAHNP